ncbi:MAG: ornithine carbamoyltransferase [PVC group bacterium]
MMLTGFKGRSLLTLREFTPGEIDTLLRFSIALKREKAAGTRKKRLEGKNIALIFEKPSTRTRCAFVVAACDEGAHPEYLGKSDIQLGKKETVKDTARVLGRLFDGIQFRGFQHETVEELARFSGVPVWNGLTDRFHPTQALADLMTILERKGELRGVGLAYVGDGRNNVANSLMLAAASMGMNCRIVAPEPLFPAEELVREARLAAGVRGGTVTITADIDEGVAGAEVVYTDVWASMGEEDAIMERIRLLSPYRLDSRLMERTGRTDALFMHCLPSFHNADTDVSRENPGICETTDDVFESAGSVVFDQAENRMHTIKAVMVATLTGSD